MKSNRKSSNNVMIAIMFLIIVVLLVYIIFFNSSGSGRTEFYSDITKLQNKISYYLGTTHAEMFGTYEIENILTGVSSEGEEIKKIDDTSLTPLVYKDQVIEKNDTKYYKLKNESLKELINEELPTYDGLDWYISLDGSLKVKLSGTTPKWWNDNLEKLKLS